MRRKRNVYHTLTRQKGLIKCKYCNKSIMYSYETKQIYHDIVSKFECNVKLWDYPLPLGKTISRVCVACGHVNKLLFVIKLREQSLAHGVDCFDEGYRQILSSCRPRLEVVNWYARFAKWVHTLEDVDGKVDPYGKILILDHDGSRIQKSFRLRK